MRNYFLLFIFFILFSCYYSEQQPDNQTVNNSNSIITINDGDLIFQTSQSSQSVAIQLATNSKYSHCGIIFKNNNEIFVLEAVQPVKITKFEDWIERGENQHYVIKRLKNAKQILNKAILLKMRNIGESYLNKNYDIYFEWSDEKLYCSELIWKIYQLGATIEIGKLQKLSDFNLSNKLVTNKLRKRYGNKIPLNETVISPASIFNSSNLETVFEN